MTSMDEATADTRAMWLHYCNEVRARGTMLQLDGYASSHVAQRYERLTPSERPIVDELLIEQIAPPGTPEDRWLPLSLIENARIVAAIPVLRVLQDWLEVQNTPSAPHEWARVNRILGVLVTEPR